MATDEPYVQLDTQPNGMTYISWYVPASQRNQGIATRLAREILEDNPIRPIFAIIRPCNIASCRLAVRLGFIIYAYDDENVTYVLEAR